MPVTPKWHLHLNGARGRCRFIPAQLFLKSGHAFMEHKMTRAIRFINCFRWRIQRTELSFPGNAPRRIPQSALRSVSQCPKALYGLWLSRLPWRRYLIVFLFLFFCRRCHSRSRLRKRCKQVCIPVAHVSPYFWTTKQGTLEEYSTCSEVYPPVTQITPPSGVDQPP